MVLERTALGIEFGSTRIKAVLLDEQREIAATGSFTWENRLENGIWTYSTNDIISGMQQCFSDLKAKFENKFNIKLTTVGAIGISGMMHGYLVFDSEMQLLAPFRTWRNTVTSKEAEILSKEFSFNIPQRWSIAHLYKDVLDTVPYLDKIDYFTTLAGYVHYLLTGEKVLGINDASGMFPIDSNTFDYNKDYLSRFDALCAGSGLAKLYNLLPKVLLAGQNAGVLTSKGAKLLDVSGDLQGGIPFAAPEGDAATGMVATNTVKVKTGNVSAGTSIFAMVVVDKMPKAHREIDMVTTPDGLPVAMAHCNNCTTDINGWVSLFKEFSALLGVNVENGQLFDLLFNEAHKGSADCGGLISYNYFSGEGITDLDKGAPVFLRSPDSALTVADFMRSNIYSAFATLKIGLDLLKKENIEIENLFAHGGLFKTPQVAQRILSAATDTPVTVSKTAGEGGPYGMAVLAAFLLDGENKTLPDYLDTVIFMDTEYTTVVANNEEIDGFNRYLSRYKALFDVEKFASEGIECLKL